MTTCGIPVKYRIDEGQAVDIGSCAALLVKPASSATMKVGQFLEMHMTGDSTGPLYLLPQSPNDQVLRLEDTTDNGETGRYEAVGPGKVVLMTNGFCLNTNSDIETNGPCPVLTVTVTP